MADLKIETGLKFSKGNKKRAEEGRSDYREGLLRRVEDEKRGDLRKSLGLSPLLNVAFGVINHLCLPSTRPTSVC